MATVFAIIAFLGILAASFTVIWVASEFKPKKYKRLKDLEIQRRNLARQIAEEAHEADWVSRYLFKRFLRKGGDHL